MPHSRCGSPRVVQPSSGWVGVEQEGGPPCSWWWSRGLWIRFSLGVVRVVGWVMMTTFASSEKQTQVESKEIRFCYLMALSKKSANYQKWYFGLTMTLGWEDGEARISNQSWQARKDGLVTWIQPSVPSLRSFWLWSSLWQLGPMPPYGRRT